MMDEKDFFNLTSSLIDFEVCLRSDVDFSDMDLSKFQRESISDLIRCISDLLKESV